MASAKSTKYTTLLSLNLFESFLRAFTTSQSPAASGNLPPSASPCRSSGPVNSSGAQVVLRHRLCAWPSSSSLAQLEGDGSPEATITPKDKIKLLGGSASGTAAPTLSLTIMEGTILGTMVPHGRLKHTYRISGTASGTSSNSATLTVTTPGGGY